MKNCIDKSIDNVFKTVRKVVKLGISFNLEHTLNGICNKFDGRVKWFKLSVPIRSAELTPISDIFDFPNERM